MIDAERLDRAYIERGGDHAPFHRLMSLRLELAAQVVPDGDMILSAASVAKESGEAVSAILEAATSDDAETHFRAMKEGEEALASLTSAMAALRSHKRGG